MKHTFVLDANILMRVLKGNKKAINLWTAILRNCHKIAVNLPLFNEYDSMWKRERKRLAASSAAVDTPRLVQELLQHQEKTSWYSVAKQDPRRTEVRHQKDWFLPALVQDSKGRLVTTDEKTRGDLGGLTIEEALRLARERNGVHSTA